MRRPARSSLALVLPMTLAIALASPAAAQDAGQVTKPPPSPAGGTRLPAPRGLSVRQDERGAIVVAWAPVEGAVRYNLGRSVGTEGFRQAIAPDPQATTYVDTRVTQGIRHVYSIIAVDAQGIAGVRATTEVFIPSRPYAGATAAAPAAPASVIARVHADRSVGVSWTGATLPLGGRYEIRRNRVPLQSRTMPSLTDPGLPTGYYTYEVAVRDQFGRMSPWTASNAVGVQGSPPADSGATSGGATGGTGGATGSGIAAEDAGGTVLVNVATPVTLRAGATHTLVGVPQSGWTSLSPSIASVTADGTVTARAGGVAQLATVGTDASGAVRVTVVRVRVTP